MPFCVVRVELRIADKEEGFSMEFWGENHPEIEIFPDSVFVSDICALFQKYL